MTYPRPHHGHRGRAMTAAGRLVLAAVLPAALAGCGDGPVAPQRDLIDVPQAILVATIDAIDDAADRVAVQLDQASGGATLRGRLEELAARVPTRDAASVADALSRSRSALEAADASGPADEAPDRAAIRMTLDRVQQLLSPE